MKCLGGTIQGKLWPKDDDEKQRALDAGHDLDRVLYTDDLVSGENVFFVATGITDGELLRGFGTAPRPLRPSRSSCGPSPGRFGGSRRSTG